MPNDIFLYQMTSASVLKVQGAFFLRNPLKRQSYKQFSFRIGIQSSEQSGKENLTHFVYCNYLIRLHTDVLAHCIYQGY